MAACARLLAQDRRKLTAGSTKNPPSEAMRVIKERLVDAPKIKLLKGRGVVSEGFFEFFVKLEADGNGVVVGQRRVAASAVRRFVPMAAKPAGGVARKRR